MIIFKTFMKDAAVSKLAFALYIIIFGILIISNSYSTSPEEKTFKEIPIKIAIIDLSKTDISDALVQYLKVKNKVNTLEGNENTLKEDVYTGKYDAGIVINRNFKKDISSGKKAITLINPGGTQNGLLLGIHLKTFFAMAKTVEGPDGFDVNMLKSSMNKEVKVEMLKSSDTDGQVSAKRNWAERYYNWASYIVLALISLMIGNVMVDFKNKGIVERSRITKIKATLYNRYIYLGQIVLAIVVFISIVILGEIIRKALNYSFSPWLYALNLLVFAIAITGIINLVYNITINKNVVNIVSVVMSLGVSFISGVMVPIEYLSPGVLLVGRFFPSYYLVKANEATSLGNGEQWFYLLIILGFAMLYFVVAAVVSKVKAREV